MSGRLAGKVALITGGTSGIGMGTVRRFRAEGAEVVFTGSNEAAAAVIADETGASFIRQRVENADEWPALMAAILAKYGRLDIAFANAGMESGDSSVETITTTFYVPVTPQQAVERAKREASSGDAKFQNYLAQMYYAGYLVPRDDQLARRWFEASARQGNAASQGQFGYFLAQGIGGNRDLAEGLKWLRLGADQGDGAAESFYGTALLTQGIRDPKFDPRPALAYTVRGAEKGEVTAQAMLGQTFRSMEVWRLQSNPVLAVRWLRAAADQGEANSMESLADYYLTGTGGLTADPLVALKLLQDAAAKKQPAALRKLAAYHAQGYAGLTPSMPEALKLLQQSADLGDLIAQYQYGAMLLQDPKNVDPAPGLAYLRRSADGNFYLGLDYLAREYFIGKRLPRDLRQAVALARRSIDNGLEPPHAPTLALLADPEMVRAAAELDSATKR